MTDERMELRSAIVFEAALLRSLLRSSLNDLVLVFTASAKQQHIAPLPLSRAAARSP